MIPIGVMSGSWKSYVAPPPPKIFSLAYTGAEETFTVYDATTLTAKLWGGAGGGGWYGGGRWSGGGGYTEIVYPVATGDIITVMVAGGGMSHNFAPAGATGGWPDGGTGSYGDASGGGGGGSTRLFVNEVLVAVAGGGGAAAGYSGWGGSGGGASGVDSGVGFGRPGTQTNAGYAGGLANALYPEDSALGATYWENGSGPITFATRARRTGGHGGPLGGSTGGDGGAGGGGYYGGAGGSGDARAGGGGSGFVHASAISASTTEGVGGGGAPPASTDVVYPGGGVAQSVQSNTGTWGGNGFAYIKLT